VGEEARTIKIVHAISVRASCMVHGNRAIHGRQDTAYNLGHGKLYISLGEVDCQLCGEVRDYLYLHVITEEEVELDMTEFARIMSQPLSGNDEENDE
jgi:hypothetical protein